MKISKNPKIKAHEDEVEKVYLVEEEIESSLLMAFEDLMKSYFKASLNKILTVLCAILTLKQVDI